MKFRQQFRKRLGNSFENAHYTNYRVFCFFREIPGFHISLQVIYGAGSQEIEPRARKAVNTVVIHYPMLNLSN